MIMASPMRLGGEESITSPTGLDSRSRFHIRKGRDGLRERPLNGIVSRSGMPGHYKAAPVCPPCSQAPAAGRSPIFYESKAGVGARAAWVACRAYLPYIVLTVRSYPSLARSSEGGAGGRDLPALIS